MRRADEYAANTELMPRKDLSWLFLGRRGNPTLEIDELMRPAESPLPCEVPQSPP